MTRKPRTLRRRGQAVLPVIAGLLIASGLLRIGDGAHQALAVEGEEETAAEPATCVDVDGPEALLEAFRDREARIAEQERALDERMAALTATETEIGEQLSALVAAEEALSATLARAETAAEDDLSRLTAVYENMKPQDAAELFATMDPAFSAGFMGRMRPDAAAAIMTNLEADIAYSISAILAGRNAGAPTE